jgi:retron-type reverse transcriptase
VKRLMKRSNNESIFSAEIYEEDFLGFSYGFRPGRSQHDALDALHVGILRRQVNWVLDADIRGFLDRDSYYTLAYEV